MTTPVPAPSRSCRSRSSRWASVRPPRNWAGVTAHSTAVQWGAVQSSRGSSSAQPRRSGTRPSSSFVATTSMTLLGLGSQRFWLLMAARIPVSVRRTTLFTLLFHFMTGFAGELFSLSDSAELYKVLLLLAVAIVVTIVWVHWPWQCVGSVECSSHKRRTHATILNVRNPNCQA